MPKDVAGISRPGLFENVSLDAEGGKGADSATTATVIRGTAATATFRAQGPRATATPTFEAPNAKRALPWAAEAQGATTPEYADSAWPSPARTVRRGR